MLAGTAGARRLPFTFHAQAGVGRLVLAHQNVGPVHVERLELEVTDLGTDPGNAAAERFQRRRTRLRGLAVKLAASELAAVNAVAARTMSKPDSDPTTGADLGAGPGAGKTKTTTKG